MSKKSAVLFVIMAGSLLLTLQAGKAEIPPKTKEFEPQFLDKVYFGKEDSEGDRVTVINAPVIEGGLDVPAREVAAENGEISVELACDPDQETFVTIRLWGGEPSATHLAVAVEGESVGTPARVGEPRQDGRFFYVTMAIPGDHTDGQESVTVTLSAGNDSPDHAYAAYTHVENFYAPPPEEAQGEPLEEPEPSDPDFDVLRENLVVAADAAIEAGMEMQVWDEGAKTHGQIGGIRPRENHSVSTAFVKAYKLEESSYHGDEEMIERALADLDYMCRYQGYRGTLERYYGGGFPWIGGPDRTGFGGGLPGFSGTYTARTFLELMPILEERPELLEAQIDNTGDGEATVTRREAYTQFWRDYLWENMLPRFAVAQKVYNQITVNGTSMFAANEILKFLSPEDAAPDAIMQKQLWAKAGILPIEDEVVDFLLELQVRNNGEYGDADELMKLFSEGNYEPGDGRYYESKHWHWSSTRHYYPLSPKGIGIEFGYSPGYSLHMNNIYMDQIADDHRISDQIRRYFDGTQHVIYPTSRQTGARWSVVGAIGERSKGAHWNSLGTGEKMSQIMHAALELDSAPAKRILYEQLRAMGEIDGFQGRGSVEEPFKWLGYLPDLREWYENYEPTDYRLPAEREGPYAWCDEMIGLALIHDSDGTHYLENAYPDGQKRYHRITPTYRAFGDAKTEFCQASHVETAQLGPYEIVMNRSNTRDVRVEGGPRPYVPAINADGVIDIVSGEAINPSGDQLIGPNESLVLDKRRIVNAPAEAPRPELVDSTVDESTRTKHWEWTIPVGCANRDVYNLPLGDSDTTAQVAKYYEDAISRGTRQHSNQVFTFYRPDQFEPGTPLSVQTDTGEVLAIETIDGCTNRLVVEQPDEAASTIKATGVLPTFGKYGDWAVENTGFSASNITTENALAVEVSEKTKVTDAYPVTFTLPLEKPVKRIVFLHESSWDLSNLRTVLETDDGRTLWRGTHPEEISSPDNRTTPRATDELVNLDGKHIEDAIHFRVRRSVTSEPTDDKWYRDMTERSRMSMESDPTTVSDGWYRRISNVRIEYKDGTATYLHE